MSEPAVTLLERERELGELGSALQEARRDRGQIVLIEAAAGIGKTSLLWAALESAAQSGFTCLRARASELEHDFPYGCVRRLLEPAVAKASTAERERSPTRGRRSSRSSSSPSTPRWCVSPT